MGAVIGSNSFREFYIKKKSDSYVKDVEQLADIAKDEPQLAYSAYTKALSMRWTHLQRTIPNISEYFTPLEEAICERLIPAIVGRKLSPLERRLVAQPVRYGGLGITNPVVTSDNEFKISVTVTKNLTDLIQKQENDLVNYDVNKVKAESLRMDAEKEDNYKSEHNEILSQVDEDLHRYIQLATEKGAGSWLTAPPIQSLGYVLNKSEFRDGICLRYGWKIPNIPSHCACGKRNTVDHILNCHLGGFVNSRHDCIRNLEADLLKDICKDIKIEPELLPVGNIPFPTSTNTADKARLDVAAVGVYSPMERTFFDVRVFNPNSPSYRDKTPQQLYEMQEREKKAAYNQRVIQVEKATFTPLIFSTTGGMGPETTKFHKLIAQRISEKRKESYPDVMKHIRTRLRFALLRGTLIAIRGDRGRRRRQFLPTSDISFNTIPGYEVH